MAISISPENMKRFAEERARKKEKSGIRNFGEGFAQGAINNLTAIPNAINYGLTKGANMLLPESMQMQSAPFPYKANFADPNSNAAQWGELAGNIVSPMPGVGVLAKAPGSAMKVAGLIPGLGSKIAGGALQGGAAYSGAHATENPNQEMTLGGASIPVALGGALAGAFGLPYSRANAYLEKLRGRRESNPSSSKNPDGIRSPEDVGKLSERFPENTIDLASLANDKKAADSYSGFIGRLPFTGVRKSEEKAMKAHQKTEKDNEALWAKFDRDVKNTDIKVNYENIFKDLEEKYGAYVSSPMKKEAGEWFGNNHEIMKSLKEKYPDLFKVNKKDLQKESDITLLKRLKEDGDTLDRALNMYQKLGKKSRSATGVDKAELIEAQDLIRKDINNALEKAGRKDLIHQWNAANKSHRTYLQSEEATSLARKKQGETFSENFWKKVSEPAGKALALSAMGSLNLLTPWATAGAAVANIGAGVKGKILRSKSLRDAYVTGGQVSEKGLSKEIFPIWMRALGVPTKNSYKGEAQSSERNKRKRNEPLELTLVGGRKREDK